MPIDIGAPYDNLPVAELKDRVLAFVTNPVEDRWDRALLGQYVNTVSPRSVFLRNACVDAHVLDLGAGDGSLAIFKSWPFITRPDIRMHAVSLEVGERFDLYDDYEIANFEQTSPEFGGMLFDSIICTHFIEHLSNPARALQFFGARLKPGGGVYLEWPHPVSKNMPSLKALQECGVNVMTINFFDDGTHIEAWPMAEIAEGLQAAGLQINTAGRVWFDFLADQPMAHGRTDNNAADLTYAVWYKFAWAQYLIATKPYPAGAIRASAITHARPRKLPEVRRGVGKVCRGGASFLSRWQRPSAKAHCNVSRPMFDIGRVSSYASTNRASLPAIFAATSDDCPSSFQTALPLTAAMQLDRIRL